MPSLRQPLAGGVRARLGQLRQPIGKLVRSGVALQDVFEYAIDPSGVVALPFVGILIVLRGADKSGNDVFVASPVQELVDPVGLTGRIELPAEINLVIARNAITFSLGMAAKPYATE